MDDNKRPLVSIVVPVYNTESYLRECLDSLLAQTERNIEIVCVDDGSTDGSSEILEEYRRKDARVVLLSQRNAGVAAARNSGVAACRGKYFTFVDSDDKVAPEFCAATSTVAERNESELVGFYAARWIARALRRYPEAKRLCPFKRFDEYRCENPTLDERRFLVYLASGCCNLLFRKDFWDRAGLAFPLGVRVSEDRLVAARAFAQVERMTLIDGAYYHYRRRPGSATRLSRYTIGPAIDAFKVYRFGREFYQSSSETAPLTVSWAALTLELWRTRQLNYCAVERRLLRARFDESIDDDQLRVVRERGYANFRVKNYWAQFYGRTILARFVGKCWTDFFRAAHATELGVRTLRSFVWKKKWN